MEKLLYVLAGFVSGSILYSEILPRVFLKIDITKDHEDHNPGAANAFQSAGVPMGFLCLILDILKGAVPVYFALKKIPLTDGVLALILAAPVLGHAFSPFRRFRGGKAIAVSFGVLVVLLPQVPVFWSLAALFIFFSAAVVIRPHKLRVLLVYGLFILSVPFLTPFGSIRTGCAFVSMIVIIKHLPLYASERAEIAVPLIQLFRKKICRGNK